MPLRIDDTHKRCIDTHNHRRPYSLKDTGHNQQRQRRRKGAKQRANGKNSHAEKVDALIPEKFSQRRKGQKRHHNDQLKGIDNPNGIGRRHL